MMRGIRLPLLAALLVSCAAQAATPPAASAWSIIPRPAQMQPAAHGQVRLADGATVAVTPDTAATRSVARQFIALVAHTRGLHLRLAADHDPYATITLKLADDDAITGDAGYRLRLGEHRVRIDARTPQGLFYGSVTLWQLLTQTPEARGPATLADGLIVDHPRFAWRGLMLDSARHFQSVADIKKLIDWMALHKLNVLHWHLTDDQGWRLQIKRYPELTRIGACRKAVGPDAALTGSPDKPYCGFYTQAQVRDLVRYAQQRFVTIVPEIEIPGHAQAALASYPELGVTGKRPPVSTDWGINTWLYAPDQRSLTFLENVLDEVMALFPSTYIHIGGDEAAKDQWQASPAVQAQMKKLGLKDENALQGWMISKIGAYLDAHHRRLIGWDEILEGGVPADATVMSWRGVKGAIEAANAGHDVVLSPAPVLYLDHLQSDAPDEPAGRPQVESLKDIYDFNPVPAAIDASQARHVLGAQANLWAEYMPTFARDQHAIFPRLAALAEVVWSPAGTHDWNDFLRRMPAQLARYRALGIDYADSAWAPRFALSAGRDGAIDVALSNQTGQSAIRYTTDGHAPTAKSPRYDAPLSLSGNATTTLRAATFADDGFRLAAPRTRRIDASALRTRRSDQLDTCTHKIVLRIEDDRPLHGPRPVYQMDINDMCWIWKQAPTNGMRHLAVTVGNLPWNYALWKDAAGVVKRPTASPHGALEVHRDTCDGPRIARLPLAAAARSKLQTTLHAELPPLTGTHDLCFIATGDPTQGLWAIGNVKLSP
ncbi:beta-N-acetylhexosaminidase [Oleiagrimonas soli]|uniref:beta-N-acetylhexosaminidase n=1 Tax=Oleiagrimonas soli TaxID=1543381 RepID=A0A099CUH6_9GAMM|nr:family 20 glycosylhydrolase [Oleiagrimonas soli]KGI77573.1 hypothetical protein LF63_0109650 [Oleiagrimonas soli]MBB6182943.1 hexosaminidase [Oleiagrimonas soli]